MLDVKLRDPVGSQDRPHYFVVDRAESVGGVNEQYIKLFAAPFCIVKVPPESLQLTYCAPIPAPAFLLRLQKRVLFRHAGKAAVYNHVIELVCCVTERHRPLVSEQFRRRLLREQHIHSVFPVWGRVPLSEGVIHHLKQEKEKRGWQELQQLIRHSVNWTFRDLQDVEKQWVVMHKRAWHLTDGHNLAPFLLPQEEGGIQKHTPSHIVAKHAVGLAERLASDLDGEMLKLMQDEWNQLTRTWGTSKIREIQTVMLLEESMTRLATLLARLLYLTGLAGITLTWEAILGMGGDPAAPEQEQDPQEQSLTGGLYDYMWVCVRAYWRGKGDVDFNRDLAEGIQRLVAAGITATHQMKHLTSGEWWVETPLTKQQHLAVLQALEESFEGTRRHSVAAQRW
mmetsp:Transcript_30074/g.61939  ORF Transcript_30074/g.61939 Transcript_30074/m.61939 type:complete len:396 (-) Transcript_30074:63-1250(-)